MDQITDIQNVVQKELGASHYTDLSDQPWYVKYGICTLGLLAGILLIFSGLSDFLKLNTIISIIELSLGTILICFEVTALAKAFNFEWCGIIINLSQKAGPLLRAIIYGGGAIPIICYSGITAIFLLLPCISTGAAYFVIWMDQRRGDEAPITQNEFTEHGDQFA